MRTDSRSLRVISLFREEDRSSQELVSRVGLESTKREGRERIFLRAVTCWSSDVTSSGVLLCTSATVSPLMRGEVVGVLISEISVIMRGTN